MKINCLRGLVLGLLFVPATSSMADRPTQPRNDWHRLEQELLEQGIQTDVDSVIQAALSNPDSGIRWTAVELLGRRKDRSAKLALETVQASDGEQVVREGAALALARLGEAGATRLVEAMMGAAKDPQRRLYLATQLTDFGNFSGYPWVVEAARSEDTHLRLLSLSSLMRFLIAGFSKKDEDLSPHALLEKLLQDPVAQVRREAIFQLSLGSQSGFAVAPFVPAIQKLSEQDQSPEVQDEARLFLASWEESKRRRLNL